VGNRELYEGLEGKADKVVTPHIDYVDTELGKKLDKAENEDELDKAYVVTPDNEQVLYPIDQAAPTANTIARRGSYGELKVGDPVQNKDAVNKGYVDDIVGDIASALDAINGEVA
jgi:hypothetical protein